MIDNYCREVSERELTLLELVINVRHFKNVVKFEDKRDHCLGNIENLTKEYLTLQNKKCYHSNRG